MPEPLECSLMALANLREIQLKLYSQMFSYQRSVLQDGMLEMLVHQLNTMAAQLETKILSGEIG